jgi:DNA polymerase elongation subunit (family B)
MLVLQVLYNAQMARTWSLLLRAAHRRGFVIAGRTGTAALVESPHLLHPVEQQTVGLYTSPVVVTDFASLYPSLYRAHNWCYTTLVHPGKPLGKLQGLEGGKAGKRGEETMATCVSSASIMPVACQLRKCCCVE